MGQLITTIFFLAGTIVLLAISGGYATNAAVRVTGISEWTKDPQLTAAHRLLSGAAVATWIGIALIIVIFILLLFFGGGEEEAGAEAETEVASETGGGGGFNIGQWVLYAFIFFTLALVTLVGILSSIAANDIRVSEVPDNNDAFRQAVIAASLALGAIGLMLIFIVIRVVMSNRKKKKEKEKQQAVNSLLVGGGNNSIYDNLDAGDLKNLDI